MIETHVFVDGNIIATRRAHYGKFVSRAGLADIVKTMMQEQHKQMMKDLVDGKLVSVNQFFDRLGKAPTQTPNPPIPPNPPTPTEPILRPPVKEAAPAQKIVSPIDSPSDGEKTLDELILEHLRKNRGPAR